MALFQPYKGTGTPPTIIEDGNIYFNLTDKTILVDHNDQRYTFEGTDTNTHLITSVNNKTGAVNLTYSDVGAASSNHTHTPASIGAAAADHTHTPASIGAAAANHSHTPESIGAAAVSHTNHPCIEMQPGSANGHGGYVDFHYNGSSADFTSRIIENGNGILDINGLRIQNGTIISGVVSATYVTLWTNGSPTTAMNQQLLSGTNSNLIGKAPKFIVFDLRTSTDSTVSGTGGSQTLGFAGADSGYYCYGNVNTFAGTIGFTTGNYYYGRSNTGTWNHSTFHIDPSNGSWYFELGTGYRNNTSGTKWCIPVNIVAVF